MLRLKLHRKLLHNSLIVSQKLMEQHKRMVKILIWSSQYTLYTLLDYSSNYSDTTCSLFFIFKNETANFNDNNTKLNV